MHLLAGFLFLDAISFCRSTFVDLRTLREMYRLMKSEASWDNSGPSNRFDGVAFAWRHSCPVLLSLPWQGSILSAGIMATIATSFVGATALISFRMSTEPLGDYHYLLLCQKERGTISTFIFMVLGGISVGFWGESRFGNVCLRSPFLLYGTWYSTILVFT